MEVPHSAFVMGGPVMEQLKPSTSRTTFVHLYPGKVRLGNLVPGLSL